MLVEMVDEAKYGHIVDIELGDGSVRHGQILQVEKDKVLVQVFEGTRGIDVNRSTVRFLARPLELAVSHDILGRVFTGLGEPKDDGPAIIPEKRLDVNGRPINPDARDYPNEFIQTGISTIDGLNPLVRGQKLPVFSGAGLPHDRLAIQIAQQARLRDAEAGEFAIVFAAIGVPFDTAERFRRAMEDSGALEHTVLFLNLASDSSTQRLLCPRYALTAAEYLAFMEGKHVLVVITDMTNYCEALRQISNIRGEVPSRKGYPGYLYSDLASIYERSGRITGSDGSITQLPILTMPNDDITHPVPDLTGYITEGQMVLSRELHQRGIYPPIAVLPSLSRLMKDGIGQGRTRADHAHLSAQLYASYAHVQDVRALASVIGEEELTTVDQRYLEFGRAFEREFVGQAMSERRPIDQTLDAGWRVLSNLPQEELTRVTEGELREYYRKQKQAK